MPGDERAEGWRNIASVPRDGTPITVAPDHHYARYPVSAWTYGKQWKYYGDLRKGVIDLPFVPSHWMPLPEPPTPNQRSQQLRVRYEMACPDRVSLRYWFVFPVARI